MARTGSPCSIDNVTGLQTQLTANAVAAAAAQATANTGVADAATAQGTANAAGGVAAAAAAAAAAAQTTANTGVADAATAAAAAAAAQSTANTGVTNAAAAQTTANAALPKSTTFTTTSPLRINGGASADLTTPPTFSMLAATQSVAGSMSAADKLKVDSLYPVAKLDNTNAWDALYLFEGNTNDSSGSGRNQTVSVGTARYGQFISRYNNDALTAIALGLDNCALVTTIAALRTTDAVTLAMLFRPKPGTVATGNNLFGMGKSGSLSTDNFLYSIRLPLGSTSGTNPHRYGWFHEQGAGLAVSFDPANVWPGPSDWMLMHWTRDAAGTTVKSYLNGVLLETSGIITKATDGANTQLLMGTSSNSAAMSIPYDCACSAIKLGELSAANVLADAKHVYGVT